MLRQELSRQRRYWPSDEQLGEASRWRERLRSGLTPDQIYTAMGAKRVYWLTAIEEEARLDNELAAFAATPENVVMLRDDRQLRWERIAARIFGDARRVAEVRSLYDEALGTGGILALLHRARTPP